MISKSEYKKLKKAKEDGDEWVSKDEDGTVWTYKEKPFKAFDEWTGSRYNRWAGEAPFEVLSWDDEEPRMVGDLLEEYEKHINREGSVKAFDDPVHSPSHYKQGHIETIDKIKLLLTPEEYLGYLKGNIIKYGDRAPFKGSTEQDYDKQKVYYDWALEQMEEMQNEK